jgi:hypothetical protein
MKPPALLWCTVPLLGWVLASHGYAVSLDDEAKQVVLDYVVQRKLMPLCGEPFALSPPEHPGLHRCEVCMRFQRGTLCRTAVSTDVPTATQTARDTACTFLAHSYAEELVCSQTPPARVTCRPLTSEAVDYSKELSIRIDQEKLSAAEKRKNIQWKGTGSVETQARRTAAHPPGAPWPSLPTPWHVTLRKAHGKWTVQPKDERQMVLAQRASMDCPRLEGGWK